MKLDQGRAFGASVACVTASLMSTELILTRIFSVIVWYHFAFFAISVALFGTGTAGLFVHLRQRSLSLRRVHHQIATAAMLLAGVIVCVDLVLVNVTPDWFGGGSPFTHVTAKLVGLFALSAAPFLVGGFTLALAMTRFSESAHRLYSWDLVGAGIGCILVIPALGMLGGPVALLVPAILASGAAMGFSRSKDEPDPRLRGRARATLAVVLLVAVASPMTGWLRIRVARGVRLADVTPELNLWNSFSMVTVSPVSAFRGWGISPAYRGSFPEQKSLVIDMNALTPLTRFSGDLGQVAYATHDLSAIVYRVVPRPERACVIGAGGGKDVLAALASGARGVTAVEINPLIVEDVMKRAYRDFTGGLYLRDDVTVVVDDGRAFAARSPAQCDVLLLSMVDTSAATASGAYALTENSLYTTGAFEDFFASLRPGGVLTVSSVSMARLATGARLASIAREAIRHRGGRPEDAIAVLATPWVTMGDAVLYDLLVKPAGFSTAEMNALRRAAAELRFEVVFPSQAAPARHERSWIRTIIVEPDDAKLRSTMASWPGDVSATTDDRPFFFYQNRLSDLFSSLSADGTVLFGNGLVILARVLLTAVVVVALFLLFPLVLGRREIQRGGGRPVADVAYVACLGLGFMFVEIAMIQRLALYLGNPVYSLVAVLFVLLVAGGIGARRLAVGDLDGLRRRLRKALAVLVAYAVMLAAVLPSVLRASAAWPGGARALVAALLLAPLGFLLGAPLPAALRVVGARAGTRIPWLWAINSATSVLGSVLATITSLHAGISVSLWVGTGLYGAAFGLAHVVLSPPALRPGGEPEGAAG